MPWRYCFYDCTSTAINSHALNFNSRGRRARMLTRDNGQRRPQQEIDANRQRQSADEIRLSVVFPDRRMVILHSGFKAWTSAA
jgi:hypothetical protein